MELPIDITARPERDLDVIGIGEAMVELWAKEPLGAASSLNKAFGGDVLNSLVMIARLGGRAGFLSRLGSDPFGRSLLAAFESEGVDCTYCPLVDGINGVYFISRHADGEREFSYRRSGSAASELSEADVCAERIGAARVLLLSGITQAISKSASSTTLKAAALAREQGVVVAYDPNFRSSLWRDRAGGNSELGHALASEAFEELLPLVDLLLMSHPADQALLWPRHEKANSLARALVARVPMAAIKCGSQGSLLVTEAENCEAAVSGPVNVVDTTGAGDAWNAGLLHALLAGVAPVEALRFANSIAAWKVSRYGAIPPTREKLPNLTE